MIEDLHQSIPAAAPPQPVLNPQKLAQGLGEMIRPTEAVPAPEEELRERE